MQKSTEGKPDYENPEWTKEDFAKAMRFKDLPPQLQRALARAPEPAEGPKKVPVSIRLSADVLDALRASGEGWQTRADDVLREWILSPAKRSK